jgi:predicted DNA-binding protein
MKEAKRTMVISVRVSDAMHAELEALAKADRRKLGQYVALILEDHLADKRRAAAETKPVKGTRQKG